MLSTPPEFILSQDQTLMLIVVWTCQNFFWHSYLCLDSSLNFSLLPSFRSSAFGIFRVALLFICQGTSLSFAQTIELCSIYWTFVNPLSFRSIAKTFVFVIENFRFQLRETSFLERRRRDLNPRAAINDLHPFQGCPFDHLGTSPQVSWFSFYNI